MCRIVATLLVALKTVAVNGIQLAPWSHVGAGGTAFSADGRYELGGTVGQPGAGESAAAAVTAVGGFWAIMRVPGAPTPTESATTTATSSPTPTGEASRSATATATRTATGSPPPAATATSTATGPLPSTATATSTPTSIPSPTPTPTATTATATPTVTPRPGCVGDCNHDGQVRIDELVTLVNIALDRLAVSACQAGDRNGDEHITIDELVMAVTHALLGCQAGSTEGESP